METDEPGNPKVQLKLNTSASGADKLAGVELEDHSTEDLHVSHVSRHLERRGRMPEQMLQLLSVQTRTLSVEESIKYFEGRNKTAKK